MSNEAQRVANYVVELYEDCTRPAEASFRLEQDMTVRVDSALVNAAAGLPLFDARRKEPRKREVFFGGRNGNGTEMDNGERQVDRDEAIVAAADSGPIGDGSVGHALQTDWGSKGVKL